MATTTNFGWETPDDTDLVKDGALAMRTLGNAIDASLVDLKGGTTGQVLSKTSNTDMDFTWVTSDDANAIQNAIVDAKGDLITATAADTPARLAVGSNGDTLVADSAASTGLRWTGATGQNPVINGGMDIWQRGTSISVSAGGAIQFTADRWATNTGANQNCTISRQSTNDTTNLPFIQYCLRYQRNSGQTGTGGLQIVNMFESINSIPFAGKTVTISLWARAGSNFSSSGNALTLSGVGGTGTDQNYNGYTGGYAFASQTVTLTSNWQRFTFTGNVTATTTEMYLSFYYYPTGTAGAADYFEITGVQLDIGSVALPFRRSGGTIQGELAACQRYYQRFTADNAYSRFGMGLSTGANGFNGFVGLKVPLRAAPSSMEYANLAAYDTAVISTPDSVTITGADRNNPAFNFVKTASFTQYRPYQLIADNSTSAYIAFNAEL